MSSQLMRALARRVYRGPDPFGRCPECKNFSLNLERGSFTCFVCGEGGDAIALWIAVRGVAFAEAVRELART